MKIRSITYFCDPGWPLDPAVLQQAADFIRMARLEFQQADLEVQTTRLASIPFPYLVSDASSDTALRLAQELENSPKLADFDYLAIGPAQPDHPWSYAAIPGLIGGTQKIFVSGLLTTAQGQLALPAVHACAQVIEDVAKISLDGFANLRFSALANVPPGGPFFPGAYHRGGVPEFALAMEAADLAVRAFQEATNLSQARQALRSEIEAQAARLGQIAQDLQQRTGIGFAGFDFTLAPFPHPSRSFGKAMELLGVDGVGLHGSLAAAALLADTLDQAQYPRSGFNGLMLPVLEDAVLAERAAQGLLTVKDLLMYSAVCGTGLDTVPLPGETSAEQLAGLLLDVAALALRLRKPLAARLMPIAGKKAGDPTGFDFSYFANSRVMALEARPLRGMLAGDESLALSPRQA